MSKTQQHHPPKKRNQRPKNFPWDQLIFVLGIFLFGFVCYLQTLNNPLLQGWDDHVYISQNTAIRDFSWENIKTIFSSFYVGNYAPIHILSYSLDYTVWGLQPIGYHLTNLIFHLGNGLLIYFLITRLGHNVWVAGFTALFFTLHPVQVESVTWVTERKNILSFFLFLASFHSYVQYRQENQKLFYPMSLLLFLLALLTKSVVVTLPLILFMYDRCYINNNNLKKDLLTKVPYLALAGGMTLITILSQKQVIVDYHGGSPFATFLTMTTIYIHYFKNILFPISLSIIYHVPIVTSPVDPAFLFSFCLLLLIFWGIYTFLKKGQKKAAFWGLWFFITLLPVSQIIPISVLMHDRYLYLPIVGIGFLIALGVESLFNNKLRSALPGSLLCALILVPLSILTIGRNNIWENELTLWKDAVAKAPEEHIAHNSLANAYLQAKNHTESLAEYEKALQLKPNFAEAHYNKGRVYYMNKQFDLAKAKFMDAIRIKPDYAYAHYNLGLIYKLEGDMEEASRQFRETVRYDPGHYNAFTQIGETALAGQKYQQAIEALEKALNLHPENEPAAFNLALTYSLSKDFSNAVKTYKAVLKINPYNFQAHGNLGLIYWKIHQEREQALFHFEKSLGLAPTQPSANQIREIITRLKEDAS